MSATQYFDLSNKNLSQARATTSMPAPTNNRGGGERVPQIVSIHKKGGSVEQDKWAMEIYKQCGDLDAVYTVEAESGFVADRVSKKNTNGSRDYFLFQFNSTYHKQWLKTPEAKNPYKQIERGCAMWKAAKEGHRLKTTWYAYNVINVRPGVKDNFEIRYK